MLGTVWVARGEGESFAVLADALAIACDARIIRRNSPLRRTGEEFQDYDVRCFEVAMRDEMTWLSAEQHKASSGDRIRELRDEIGQADFDATRVIRDHREGENVAAYKARIAELEHTIHTKIPALETALVLQGEKIAELMK